MVKNLIFYETFTNLKSDFVYGYLKIFLSESDLMQIEDTLRVPTDFRDRFICCFRVK